MLEVQEQEIKNGTEKYLKMYNNINDEVKKKNIFINFNDYFSWIKLKKN